MYYLVSVDHNGMAAHLTRSDYERSNAVDGSDDCCGGMTVKRMGMLEVNVGKMKALTVMMDRVTLIGTGTLNLTHFVY
jgi:hypothetical protein